MAIIDSLRSFASRAGDAYRAFSVAPQVPGLRGQLAVTQANNDTATSKIIRSVEALFGRVSYTAGPAYTRYSSNPATGLNPANINAALLSANNGYPQMWAEMIEQVLERDGHLAGIDGARRDEVAGKPFRVHPKPNGDPDVTQPVAKFVRSVVDEIDGFESAAFDILSANGQGYASQEIVWQQGKVRFPDMAGKTVAMDAVCPRTLEWVHPKHFRFDQVTDEPYIVIGSANNSLPANKFIFHASTGTGLIERRGFMRACIWYHAAKQWALRDWITFAHIYGIPQLEGIYDADTEQQPEMRSLYETVLRDFGEGIPAIHPRDFEVKITQPPQGGKSSDVHGALMGMCNAEMSKRVQGETLTTEMGQFGSYGASETHADVRHVITVADGKKLCNTLRRDLLRPIVELNVARLASALGRSPEEILAAVPVASFRIEREMSPAARQAVYEGAVNKLGLEIDETQYRDEMGFDAPRPGSNPLRGEAVTIASGGAAVSTLEAGAGVKVDKPEPEKPAAMSKPKRTRKPRV